MPPTILRQTADAILNLAFPESCFICSVPVSRQQDCGLCDACWEKALQFRIREPWCPSCGLPLQNFEAADNHLCGDCVLTPPPYAVARSFGYYAAELGRIIQQMKFKRRQDLVGLLAPLLARTFFDNWDQSDFDLVVPVPLHAKKKRERGFNQAAILARALARRIAVPFLERALSRTRYTKPQVGLTDLERAHNVRGAFECRDPVDLSGLRVLLVDDVMTTGATVASAAEALRGGGALRVSVLTVARTVPGL